MPYADPEQKKRYLREYWANTREYQNAKRRTPEARAKASANHAEWRRKNKDRRAADMRAWRAKSENRIASNLRSRIANALKGRTKFLSLVEVTGACLEDLVSWLQIQFLPGMSWENYGQWEIDHVRPCASFDLSKEGDQRKCFHFSNLQPLWKLENRRKNDTYVL